MVCAAAAITAATSVDTELRNNGRIRRLTAVLCVVLAGLELVHPAWSSGAVADAVTPLWVPLHVALLTGYALLTVVLYQSTASWLARSAVVLFAVLNTAFLGIDGLVIGLRAPIDSASANALWSSPAVTLLADATGALWSATLLVRASTDNRDAPDRAGNVLIALTWLTFVIAALGVPLFVSRLAAIAAGVWLAYRGGTTAIGGALFAFAAVLRQHVGPEAALGLLCVAVATLLPGSKKLEQD